MEVKRCLPCLYPPHADNKENTIGIHVSEKEKAFQIKSVYHVIAKEQLLVVPLKQTLETNFKSISY